LHSIISAKVAEENAELAISATAGHSLGEFSALVAANALKFEDGLRLVYTRAEAMQKACDQFPGTMAAIVGMEDEVVETVCAATPGVVVAANYNCPGQLVISGEKEAVQSAMSRLKELGCRNAVQLSVGGAFHSPLMKLAESELQTGIEQTEFSRPDCPVYQNIDGMPHQDPADIRHNLIRQLTGPVRWSQIIQQMLADGITEFVEVGGNGKVLAGLIKRIDRKIPVSAI
jgi:[acyl-carrier-protein] S-malonyltransferase